jgi:two-component system sensor histidine kinase HydH
MPAKTDPLSYQQLHRLYEESRRNSEFLNKLISGSNDAIVTTDLHGRIDFWSKPAERMLGYTPRQALGKPVTEIYFAGKEEAERVMQELRRGARVQNWETVLRKADGSSLHASISISLLKDEAGNPVGTLGVVRDISEVRQLQQQLRQSERLATIGELASHIAHEIRNPLSSVKMNLQILSRMPELQGRAREHMDIALQEIDHLDSILAEIVDFVRPLRLNKQSVDLSTIMEEALLMAEDALQKAEIKLLRNLGSRTELRADPVRVRQAFLNLLLNAIQATEPGGTLRISIQAPDTAGTMPTRKDDAAVSAEQEHDAARDPVARGYYQVEIQDSGRGIAFGRLQQIFEPFFTTRSDGTGLGLTITKRIVEAHGGEIHVESTEGVGTTFRVVFPNL